MKHTIEEYIEAINHESEASSECIYCGEKVFSFSGRKTRGGTTVSQIGTCSACGERWIEKQGFLEIELLETTSENEEERPF